MRGIDISEFQRPGSVSFDGNDFVIIRASYGNGGLDKHMKAHADMAIAQNKLIGFYHYAYPDFGNSAEEEAETFLTAVKSYIGKGILALDWEGKAIPYPASWALEFMDIVARETGATPFFYTFASETKKDKWKQLAQKYPLWVAHWGTDKPDCGVWGECLIQQYSDKPVDQDITSSKLTRSNWHNYTGGNNMTQQEFDKMMDTYLAERAAKSVSKWAVGAVENIKDLGIMVGDANGRIRAQSFVTREEVAQVISSLIKRYHPKGL